MASPTQWTRVLVNSGSWWWTGRPGVLWFLGSQRVRHDWVTELNCSDPAGVQFCLILSYLAPKMYDFQDASGTMGFWSGIVNVVHDMTFPTKFHTVKAMVFSVVMYRCESWTIKKAEHWRSDAFQLRCWRRFSRVPFPASKLSQSILKEINPQYSLEGLMLKLKLKTLAIWCEDLTQWKRPWFWERLQAKGEKGGRGWDG